MGLEKEREGEKEWGLVGGRCRERVRERDFGGREAGKARRRVSPANHEAESCYVTGGGRAEENQAQILENVVLTLARVVFQNKGRIRNPTRSYTKLDLF